MFNKTPPWISFDFVLCSADAKIAMFGSANRSLSWQHQNPEWHESITMTNLDCFIFFLYAFQALMIYLSWKQSPFIYSYVSPYQSPFSSWPCPEYTRITWDYAVWNLLFNQLKVSSLLMGSYLLVYIISSIYSLSLKVLTNRSLSCSAPRICGRSLLYKSGTFTKTLLEKCSNLQEARNIKVFTLL